MTGSPQVLATQILRWNGTRQSWNESSDSRMVCQFHKITTFSMRSFNIVTWLMLAACTHSKHAKHAVFTYRMRCLQVFKSSWPANQLPIDDRRKMYVQNDTIVDGKTKYDTYQFVLSLSLERWGIKPDQTSLLVISKHTYTWQTVCCGRTWCQCAALKLWVWNNWMHRSLGIDGEYTPLWRGK